MGEPKAYAGHSRNRIQWCFFPGSKCLDGGYLSNHARGGVAYGQYTTAKGLDTALSHGILAVMTNPQGALLLLQIGYQRKGYVIPVVYSLIYHGCQPNKHSGLEPLSNFSHVCTYHWTLGWALPDAGNSCWLGGWAWVSSGAARRSPSSPEMHKKETAHAHLIRWRSSGHIYFQRTGHCTCRVGRSINMCLSSLPGLMRALSKMSARFVEARTITWSVVPIPIGEW